MLTAIENIAWAAAFLEAEGNFRLTPRGYAQLEASQTERAPLERLKRVLGGHVNGPYKPQKSHHSPVYRWRLGAQEEVKAALRLITPKITPGSRRRQAQLLLSSFRYGPDSVRAELKSLKKGPRPKKGC